VRRAAANHGKGRRLRTALYHHIAPPDSSLVNKLDVTTLPDVFESHVRKMARNYEFASLDDVLEGVLPRRALLITFDDGYRSIVEVALPILRNLGIPSVFFITGACLNRKSLPLDNLLSHCCATVGVDRIAAALDPTARVARTFPQLLGLIATMPYGRRLGLGDDLAERFEVDQARLRFESRMFLDPDDLAGLAAYGCEVASHTRTHLFCRSIVDEEAADEELVAYARRLKSLTGRPVRAFSYPYGNREDATPLVERMLRESGHAVSFLAESRPDVAGAFGHLYNRVCLDGCPPWRVGPDLEVMPGLRVVRDRVRR
jgi:peptidoglycan/xylan/chitin deacetylase (PgdA/CDA1 family)